MRNICCKRRYLPTDSLKILVHAFITQCVLGYAYALSYGLPKSMTVLLNVAKRCFELRKPNHSHVTQLLMQLHWHAVSERIVLTA